MKHYAIQINSTNEDKAVCALMEQFDWGCSGGVPKSFPCYRTEDTLYYSGAAPFGYTLVQANHCLSFFLGRQWEDKPEEKPEWEKFEFGDMIINTKKGHIVFEIDGKTVRGSVVHEHHQALRRALDIADPQPKPDPELMRIKTMVKDAEISIRFAKESLDTLIGGEK